MKEIETYTAKKQGNIMLNANELYKNISQEILEEIKEEISKLAFHRYPDETNRELIDAYAKVMDIDSDCILAGNGSDEMLGLLIGTFLGKGKTLYTLSPDFSMYDYYASMHEAELLKFSCAEDGSFSLYDFIEYGRENTVDMILFSNPNNPSGHALSNCELKEIVEAFPTIPVIIDEAYAEFAEESMLSLLEVYPNLYVTRTLSKAYGLAGARLGFLLSNRDNIKQLRANVVPYNISSITQKVGVVVLRHALEYQPIIKEIIMERNRLYERLKNLKRVTFYPSHANYLYGRCAQKALLMDMFEKEGIVIRTYADDTFRITIGTKEENALVEAVLQTFEKEECTV